MNWLFGRLLTFLIWLRHPKLAGDSRWFLRFYYLGTLNQIQFFINDFILKRRYKEIVFSGEFQHELLYVLPHAYWHHLNGTLKKTVSANSTSPFYFFSTDHDERFEERQWKGNLNTNFPNGPHNHRLNRIKWARVPLKEHYRNDIFHFEKPILVIANRYSREWGGNPISYFDLDCLDRLIKMLGGTFQVIYNRPGPNEIINDENEILEFEDRSWIKQKHPGVILLGDLASKMDTESYNELQLYVYANCNSFISIHGGTATLASYFGGNNIILSRRGHEHRLNEFQKIFTQVANTKIHHVKSYDDLYEKVTSIYLR